MNNLVLLLLLFFVSCAGYVSQVHKQIDREDKVVTNKNPPNGDQYGHFRDPNQKKRYNDRRPIKNPITYSLGSGPSGQVRPPVKREYRQVRRKASDFTDTENGGSLWTNQGSSSALFTYQNDKRSGDMVIIHVLENLRNQISSELKRAFPDRPKKGKKSDKKTAKAGEKDAPPPIPAPANPNNDNEMDMKVYDKISGMVMEEVNKDYILLRGRKEIIFKKEKRSIEVQALVSRKDIMENDYVNSDKLLESRVFILRNRQ